MAASLAPLLCGTALPAPRLLVGTPDTQLRRIILHEADRAGFEPLVAHDGADALEWLALEMSYPGSLSLAVIDVALPGYPGLALASSIRSNRLDVAVILVQRPGQPLIAGAAARLGLLGVLDGPNDRHYLRSLLTRVRSGPVSCQMAPEGALALESA